MLSSLCGMGILNRECGGVDTSSPMVIAVEGDVSFLWRCCKWKSRLPEELTMLVRAEPNLQNQ